MLVLRAFPLSFAILWRFILALPILLIFLAVYVTFTVIWGIFVGFFSIYLTVAMIMGMTFVMALIPTLTGIRLGLQAREETVRGHFGKVFGAALGYGGIEAFLRMLLAFGAAGAVVFLTPALSSENFWPVFMQTVSPSVEGGSSTELDMGTVAFLITLVLYAMLRAALLPTLAGAAACGDPGSGFHTPFSGFGSSFFALFILQILIYLLPIILIPVAIIAAIHFDLTGPLVARAAELQAIVLEGASYQFALIDGIMVAAVIVFSLWLFSLQCAGAVLSFAERRENRSQQDADRPEVQRIPADDLREMVRARMPERKY
jgi:hypothetical protein